MTIPKDYSNQKYGRLTTIKEVEPYVSPSGKSKSRQYECECECGNRIIVSIKALRNGNTKSCGCFAKDIIIKRNKGNSKYGEYTHHKHFKRWKGMIERCYYEVHKDYHNYGGRGIKVCEEWKNHPKKFIEWIENESNYKRGLTLDRINVNGDYEPGNCRFVNNTTQSLNRNISKNNKSGYPGVSKHKNKWRARINVNGKRKSLGVFPTKDEAIESRKNAELEYYGKILH